MQNRFGPLNREVIEVTIANGQSQATEINMGRKSLVGIEMPASWTAAVISFLARGNADGTALPVYNLDGAEMTLAGAAASRYLCVDGTQLTGAQLLTVRSGTAGSPVNQGAARTLRLIVKPLDF